MRTGTAVIVTASTQCVVMVVVVVVAAAAVISLHLVRLLFLFCSFLFLHHRTGPDRTGSPFWDLLSTAMTLLVVVVFTRDTISIDRSGTSLLPGLWKCNLLRYLQLVIVGYYCGIPVPAW